MTAASIISNAEILFGIPNATLVGRRRSKSVAYARNVCMIVMRDAKKMSLKEIGDEFGGRDHCTVIRNIRNLRGRMETESQISWDVQTLIAQARQGAELAAGEVEKEVEAKK
jgi:chromosomal replication initiator protein